MELETLKDFIQSANINFLIGSGLSSPYLTTLGNIEKLLASLNLKNDIDHHKKDIIAASIYKKYFEDVMLPNCTNRIPSEDSEKGKQYIEVIRQYKEFLNLWTLILHKRSNSLLSRQINIYTTNIDVFMERAAEETKVEFNDGFRGTLNPIFDETMFQKRVIKNSVHFQNSTEVPTFNLLKIHGGINWLNDGEIIKNDNTLSQITKIYEIIQKAVENGVEFIEVDKFEKMIEACESIDNIDRKASLLGPFMNEYDKLVMVNPNKSKFSLTVLDSHFYEMIRMFSNSLEKENSVLMVMGFSFADEHLLNIVCRAARRNPTLQIIIFAYEDNCVEDYKNKFKSIPNISIASPSALVYKGERISTKFSFEGINQVFFKLSSLIPNIY